MRVTESREETWAGVVHGRGGMGMAFKIGGMESRAVDWRDG